MRARRLIPLSLAVASALAVGSAAVQAAPPTYRAPPETATLAPGPNLDLAQANCSICHSVDYISTQPRNFANPRAVWTAEVTKMRKAYGATISDEDAEKIVDYLVAAYGA